MVDSSWSQRRQALSCAKYELTEIGVSRSTLRSWSQHDLAYINKDRRGGWGERRSLEFSMVASTRY